MPEKISMLPVYLDSPGADLINARLAQSVERKALNLVVVGSSPTVGVFPISMQRHRPLKLPTQFSSHSVAANLAQTSICP